MLLLHNLSNTGSTCTCILYMSCSLLINSLQDNFQTEIEGQMKFLVYISFNYIPGSLVYIFETLSKSSKSLEGRVCGQVKVASEFKRESGLQSYTDVNTNYISHCTILIL